MFGWLSLEAQDSFADRIKWKADTELESFHYLEKRNQVGNWQTEWKTNAEVKFQVSDHLSFSTNIQGNIGQVPDRMFFAIRELFAAYRKKRFIFRAGKQIVDWGNLPGWSPSGLPNRYRYYDFLDTKDEEIGIWALHGGYVSNSFTFRMTLSPFFRPSELYLTGNRWIDLPAEIGLGPGGSQLVQLLYQGSERSDQSDGYQFGLETALQLGKVEWAVNAFHGYNDIPLYRLLLGDPVSETSMDYRLELVYHNMSILSTRLKTYFGDWNGWFEFAHTRSRMMNEMHEPEPSPFYTLTLGTDRVFLFDQPEKQLKLLFQYIYTFNTQDIHYAPNDLDHVFRNTLLTRIAYRLNYAVSIELTALAELETAGYYFRPGITWKITDALHLSGGTELLGGKDRGFFGYYRDNARTWFSLAYSFIPKRKK